MGVSRTHDRRTESEWDLELTKLHGRKSRHRFSYAREWEGKGERRRDQSGDEEEYKGGNCRSRGTRRIKSDWERWIADEAQT
jgi:hypothetical protein